MKLVSKYTAILGVAICALLLVDGYLGVEREIDLFDADMVEEASAFGGLVVAEIENAWADDGQAAAERILEVAAKLPHAPGLKLVPHLGDRSEPLVVRGDHTLKTYLPIAAPGERLDLEVTQTLEARDSYISNTVVRTIILVALTGAVFLVIALVLGEWLVGRPIEALIARTRAIGSGDLAARGGVNSRDELGALSRAFDAMSQRLLGARDELAAAHQRQLATERQLRHADRLATVGTLAAGVAHELGTPLNVVIERAAIAEAGDEDDDELRDNGRIIREQGLRMARIIKQILAFARRPAPTETRFEATALARDAVELLDSYARARDVVLELVEPEPAASSLIRGDYDELEQALTNLVVNAVQASPTGATVRVAVSIAEATPPRGGVVASEHVRIEIIDRGCGINAETLPRIFEPFFTTKDVGVGTGLGLSITQAIVSACGGWLEIASEVDEGTRVSLYLPRVSAGDQQEART